MTTQAQIDAVRDREMLINATIERCAKELDRLMMRAAAAAIRAMKDKP